MTALVLGSIVFKDYEIPEKVRFGVEQLKAVHTLIGGQRVIDALGPSDKPLKWGGRFQGPDATDRARALMALAASGSQVPLTFGSFQYLVLVDDAEAEFERWYQIPYTVSCTVVSSSFGGVFAGPGASLDGIVTADLAVVSGLLLDFAGAL